MLLGKPIGSSGWKHLEPLDSSVCNSCNTTEFFNADFCNDYSDLRASVMGVLQLFFFRARSLIAFFTQYVLL